MSVELTEKELRAIREEAEREYPGLYEATQYEIDAYIEGVKKERQKAKELVKALEEILMQKVSENENDYLFAFNRNWHIADKALSNYQNSLNKVKL